MCRRCGERDQRPYARQRRRLARRLLEQHGNGVICPCLWCGVLLSATGRQYLTVPDPATGGTRRLRIQKLERDRLIPGGSYALYNLVPACGPCNRARSYDDAQSGRVAFPDGCEYGTTAAA